MRNSPEKIGGRAALDYVDRVNRAIDFILRRLDQPLRLETVARAACFSPFHFHRIFRKLVGESLNEFIKRVRLERALVLLSLGDGTACRRPTLTEVAFRCGFASSSDFARCFKERYGLPPSRFDVESFRARRREEWLQASEEPEGRHRLAGLPRGENPDGFEARLRVLPRRCVAYLRVGDPFRPGRVTTAAERLVRWAQRRGLADGQWLGYMWDDPDITAPERCRYDVGVEVPPETTPDGGIGRLEFPAMQVAELEIRGGLDLELRALDWLFGTWLPSSGFVPDEQPCFEAWNGLPFAHGYEHFELRLQLPVARG